MLALKNIIKVVSGALRSAAVAVASTIAWDWLNSEEDTVKFHDRSIVGVGYSLSRPIILLSLLQLDMLVQYLARNSKNNYQSGSKTLMSTTAVVQLSCCVVSLMDNPYNNIRYVTLPVSALVFGISYLHANKVLHSSWQDKSNVIQNNIHQMVLALDQFSHDITKLQQLLPNTHDSIAVIDKFNNNAKIVQAICTQYNNMQHHNQKSASLSSYYHKKQLTNEIVFMIVDDIVINRILLLGQIKEAINKLGLNKTIIYIEAENGVEAMHKYNSAEHVDYIFMDMLMPQKNGLEATADIRKIEEEQHRNASVIIGVSSDICSLKQGKQDKLLNGYIVKPVTISKLQANLTTIIGESKKACKHSV